MNLDELIDKYKEIDAQLEIIQRDRFSNSSNELQLVTQARIELYKSRLELLKLHRKINGILYW